MFDNFDHPDERCCATVGDFDTLKEAIACAQGVVDKSLTYLRKREMSATDWYQLYSSFGDGIYILGRGEKSLDFNPYDYAKARIEAVIGEGPKEWGE